TSASSPGTGTPASGVPAATTRPTTTASSSASARRRCTAGRSRTCAGASRPASSRPAGERSSAAPSCPSTRRTSPGGWDASRARSTSWSTPATARRARVGRASTGGTGRGCGGSSATRHGGRGIMWKAGHSLLKAKMRETGALLGGEMSGHIFFKERYFGYDDAIYAGARLLDILARSGKRVDQLLADLPPSHTTPEIRV